MPIHAWMRSRPPPAHCGDRAQNGPGRNAEEPDLARKTESQGPLAPHPKIWKELGDGKALRAVLEDFYTRVFEDERLAPFFRDVTKQHVVDKQYSFLHSKLTGKGVYFGDRPRNAHH
jgi:hypothetical protein